MLKLKMQGMCLALLMGASTGAMAGDVLFSDDFSSASNSNWTVAAGTWTFDGGRATAAGAGGSVDAWAYAGQTSWTDYTFESRIFFGTGQGSLAFRSTGHWQNEYRLDVWSSKADQYPNTLQLIKYANGVPTSLQMVSYPVPADTTLVRVEAKGGVITVFIDGQQATQYTDSAPLTNGQIGLGVIWDWQGQFDDVKVTSLVAQPIAADVCLSVKKLQEKHIPNWIVATIKLPKDQDILTVKLDRVMLGSAAAVQFVVDSTRQVMLATFKGADVASQLVAGKNDLLVCGELLSGQIFQSKESIEYTTAPKPKSKH